MYTQAITTENTVDTPLLYLKKNDIVPKELQDRCSAENNAYSRLFQFISFSSGIALSDQEKDKITGSVKYRRLSKRQFFLQEGEVCKYIGFIINGATRMYSINERGEESVILFGLEQSWVVDYDSFKTNRKSSYHIEALENTELLVLDAAQKDHLKTHIPAFAVMFNRYHQQQLVLTQKRIQSVLSMTAEEQYADLQQNFPEYGQRFSQKMIAAYLGMKQQSLSRIRRRQLQPKNFSIQND